MIKGWDGEGVSYCPFCGGIAETKYVPTKYGYGFIVRCFLCRASSRIYSGTGEAIDSWNSRVVLSQDKAIPNCPFCGGTPEIKTVTNHETNNLIVVRCSRCWASTKTFSEKDKKAAVSAWETRVQVQEV